jgi:hypothetical protein
MPNYYHVRTSDNAIGDGYFTITGAGTINAAISDALDSTYVRKTVQGITASVGQRVKDPGTVTGGTALPISGHYITSLRALTRHSQGSTSSNYVATRYENTSGTLETLGNSLTNYAGTLSLPATITTVSSASKAATGIITVTTAAAHGLALNDLIIIQGSSTGTPTGHVNGSYRVLTTYISAGIVSATGTGTTATYSTAPNPHGFVVGQTVVVTGMAPAAYNTAGAAITAATATTFTITSTATGSSTGGGTATTGTPTTFTAQDVSAYSGFTASTVNATNGNIARGSNASSASVTPSVLTATTGTAAQDIVNRLVLWFQDGAAASSADRAYFYEAWMEVVTAALPTATVTGIDGDTSAPYAVTTTSRPTVTWTHAQADGYTQAAYRVKVFTAAQANPDTAAGAVWDSGTVNSASGSAQITTDLINNATYFVYVKTRTYTSTANDDGWSLWGSGTAASGISFTVSLPAPTAPIISLSWGSVQQRVRAVLTGKAVTAPMTAQTFDLQRSDDGGTTWYYVRGGTGQPPDGAFQETIDDFEMVRGTVVQYRARAVATGAGNTVASAWNGYALWNFEANTTGWTAGTNTTISQSATQAYAGGFSLRLAPTAAGTVSATAGSATLTPVVVGGSYTASAYMRSTSASRTATIGIAWYTAAAALISTSTGTGTTITTTGFTQVSVVATAPATAAYGVVVATVAAAGSAADFMYVDNVEFAATAQGVSVPALTNWVFRSLGTSGELNIAKDVKVLGDLELQQDEDLGVFTPMGRSAKVVVHGTVRGEDGAYDILCPDQATFDTLAAVLNGRALVLVADPFGEQKYIRITGRTYSKTGAAAAPRYYVNVQYVQVDSGLTAG